MIFEILNEKLRQPSFILNMAVHSLILFTFLSAFFAFFVAKLSEDAFKDEVNKLIDEGLHPIVSSMNDSQTTKGMLHILPLDQMEKNFSAKDKTVAAKNQGIINSMWTVNIVLWIGLIVAVMIASMMYDLDIKHVLIENAATFAIIGIAEYLFFTKIALKFIPVEPSFITKQMMDKVKSKVGDSK